MKTCREVAKLGKISRMLQKAMTVAARVEESGLVNAEEREPKQKTVGLFPG